MAKELRKEIFATAIAFAIAALVVAVSYFFHLAFLIIYLIRGIDRLSTIEIPLMFLAMAIFLLITAYSYLAAFRSACQFIILSKRSGVYRLGPIDIESIQIQKLPFSWNIDSYFKKRDYVYIFFGIILSIVAYLFFISEPFAHPLFILAILFANRLFR